VLDTVPKRLILPQQQRLLYHDFLEVGLTSATFHSVHMRSWKLRVEELSAESYDMLEAPSLDQV
jgi:hypothetical protein